MVNLNVFTKSYVLTYEIEGVPFYVDWDGDLTSNIQKAGMLDKETAFALVAMYRQEGIDMMVSELETSNKVTI